VIEEGDRINAGFTYNGTFSTAFTGPQQVNSLDPPAYEMLPLI